MAFGQARPSVAWATENGLIWFVFLWTVLRCSVVELAHCPLANTPLSPPGLAWSSNVAALWKRRANSPLPPAHIVVRGTQGLPPPSSKKGSTRRTHTHPSLPPKTGPGAEKWADRQTDRQTDEWLALLALVNVLATRARATAAAAGAVSVVGKRVKGKEAEGERERE